MSACCRPWANVIVIKQIPGRQKKRGYEMSEAKPQDGSTVKGYRTLTPGDIERMNRLKGVSRHFCRLLDTEREVVTAEGPE